MKIKILIVDDERQIRLGLQQTIDWARIGISEVYAASNAHEGMTMFYRHRPQIVLMDLMMPGMDGIQACERLKREDKAVRIFVLTAHLKTEYVRRCLSLGIEEYFVKPVSIDEMVARIGMTVAEIVEQSYKEDINAQERSERDRQLLTRLLQSGTDPLPGQLALMGLDQPGTHKRIIAAEIFAPYEETVRICSSFQWSLEREKVNCVPTLLQMGSHSVYVMLAEYEELNYPKFLRSMYEVIVNNCSEDGAVVVNIAVGSQREEWRIASMYEGLMRVMKSFFFIGANALVEEDKYEQPGGAVNLPTQDELRAIVNSGSQDELMERLEEMFEGLSQGGDDAVARIHAVAAEILLMIIQRNGADVRDELYERCMCRLFDGSVRYLQEIQELILIAWEDVQKQEGDIPDAVKKIARYVQENYNRDFAVADLAKYVGLSRNYVSHVFNHTYGKTINQYLNELRIEQAKKMLVQEELSLQTISSKVGYNNYTYFTKIFRQMVGMTPSVYRMELLDLH